MILGNSHVCFGIWMFALHFFYLVALSPHLLCLFPTVIHVWHRSTTQQNCECFFFACCVFSGSTRSSIWYRNILCLAHNQQTERYSNHRHHVVWLISCTLIITYSSDIWRIIFYWRLSPLPARVYLCISKLQFEKDSRSTWQLNCRK